MTPDRRRFRPRTALVLIAWACCLAMAPGCGPADGRPRLYPASGRVTLGGKPLGGAFVLLRAATPVDTIPSPSAVTVEDGSFTLTTFETGDGAPEGDYLVAISTTPSRAEPGMDPGKGKAAADVLKGKFADPKTSGLKATVRPGSNTLGPFDLP